MLVPPLHEQLALDAYWEGPNIPEGLQLSIGTRILNLFFSEGSMAAIDGIYQQACRAGDTKVTTIEPGEPLVLSISNSVIKIVEDMRSRQIKPTRGRNYQLPEDFDNRTEDMESTLWYSGPMAGAQIDGPDGLFDISRRVSYLINPARGSWLIGKESTFLDRGGSHYLAFQMEPAPVGHIMRYETRKDQVERRVVSAQILTPAQQARRRVRKAMIAPAPGRTIPRTALGAIASATA